MLDDLDEIAVRVLNKTNNDGPSIKSFGFHDRFVSRINGSLPGRLCVIDIDLDLPECKTVVDRTWAHRLLELREL